MRAFRVSYEYKVSEDVVIIARTKKEAMMKVKNNNYTHEDILEDVSEPQYTGSDYTNITAEEEVQE